jgi:integrase
LDKGTARVIHGLHRLTGQGLVLLPPKSANSRRTVSLALPVVDILRSIQGRQVLLQEMELGLPSWDETGYVFARADGTPFDPEKVTYDFADRMAKAGLTGLRLHDLRHSFATLMLASGADWKQVQSALGHSSAMVTMDIYAHQLPGSNAAAAARLAE